MEKKGIAIVGSTGSIGKQALDVVERTEEYEVVALSCNSNIDVLLEQIKHFKPKSVCVGSEDLSIKIKEKLQNNAEVAYGTDGLVAMCSRDDVDLVLNSTVGVSGFIPTVESIKAGKQVALANKESLVAGGKVVYDELHKRGGMILPVDSEHSAIFQCLQGNEGNRIEKIILTASGGPFRGKKREELASMNAAQALMHPTWKMGNKITIDSSTLMNKGFEVIEAMWLFGLKPEQIEVVIHPQSIVHSAIQYEDGSVIAQIGTPDMRIPIQYALSYPKRIKSDFKRIDFSNMSLQFSKPDIETFKCLRLAFDAMKKGGTTPAALNGANEAAVGLFLDGKIGFLDIGDMLEKIVDCHMPNTPTVESVMEADGWAREKILEYAQ